MRLLIAHRSPLQQSHLRHILKSACPAADVATAPDLTRVYDLTEHQKPDCVLIAQELLELPEFELVASLIKIMGIGCICLTNKQNPQLQHPVYPQVRQVSEQASGEQFLAAISSAVARQETTLSAPQPGPSEANYDPEAVILIGASTGGIDALVKIITHFHDNCPPVLIVQHTGGTFASSLIRLLNGTAQAKVLAATDGITLKPGHIYLAPDDRSHLTLSSGRTLRASLTTGPAVSGHRPSIDALFSSASQHASRVSAALLTGMGKDGAAGLLELRNAGAHTIGQDQQTSVVYGMPRVAMEMGAVRQQLPIQEIGPALLVSSGKKSRL